MSSEDFGHWELLLLTCRLAGTRDCARVGAVRGELLRSSMMRLRIAGGVGVGHASTGRDSGVNDHTHDSRDRASTMP